MEAPISASLGAMGSLTGKLDVLLWEGSEDDPDNHLEHRLRLPKAVKDGIFLLKEDLVEISTYLEDLSEVEDPPLTAKCWMKVVRELSYDIEDYIDSSFARSGRNTNIKTRSVCKISQVELARLPKKKLTWHKQVVNKVTEFRIRAQEANERHKRYELDFHNLRRRYAPLGPMLPTQCDEGADLVIDGKMRDIIDTIASDGDHHLKVISVVGSGGLGKTTLVRVVYNKIRGQFDCRAFVRMTRKTNIKTVLRDMLTQVKSQKTHDNCDLDLTSEIRKHLQNKRYLIIIDDLWAASVWDIINHAFPEGSQSRIIITTQIEDVALTCCRYNSEFMFEMEPLDVYHSKKLFFNKCFGCESGCPKTFNEVANKIVEICGGLPLATINMASLLASHPVILVEQWTYICDSLTSNLRIGSTSEGIRVVLNLSYNNLPHYLKTCLLYLNMYPEGCTLCKDDLVKQWVAEGFIDATEGRDMERVAGSYFDELIDRKFLQPECIKYNGEMVSCTVHDTVHDLIAYKSVEENFIMVVDHYRKSVELSDKVHRLSLHFSDAKYAKKPGNIRTSQVRSFAFFGFFVCMPTISNFKLLRVLNLQLSGDHGDDTLDLTGVSELLHLRYLKVVSDVCIQLPKHMRGLQYLETLDMDTKVTAVPWDIIHIPCLLHLHLPFETNLMDWIGSMSSANVQRLGMLTNLQDLRLTCSTSTPPPDHVEKNMESLGSLFAGLENLKTIALVPGSSHKNTVFRGPSEVTVSWDGFAPPLLLQRFEWSPCSCTFSRVPKWIGEFGNLCILKIAVNELLRDGVDILKGLPALTALSLHMHAAPVERIVFDKAGFLVLKYFKFRCSAPWLKFEADAMPNLWKLKLGFNAHRVDQHWGTPISIERLYGLKEISVKVGGGGADAQSILTATISNHPSNPRINIQLVDWIFYGDKGTTTATAEKEHGRTEQVDILEEAEDEDSREDKNKEADIRIFATSVSSSYLPVSGPLDTQLQKKKVSLYTPFLGSAAAMEDARGEEEASMFETSHVLGSLLASSPLLARAWDRCVAAATTGFVHGGGDGGGPMYVAFSGVQPVLSAAGTAVAGGGGADAFAMVGLAGVDGTRRLFAPLVAAETDAAAGEPVAVQALALQSFLKLCGSPDFQMLLNQINGKAVVFTGHSLGGAIAALTALHYLCISSSSLTFAPASPVMCITFGSPLLGNEALSRAILRERWGGNFCHVVSQHDIVPRLLFCPLDTVPVHMILGMQLQQCLARTRQGAVVTAVTTRMADTDHNELQQLIQTHLGAVAMEQKLCAPVTPGGSPYRPFGTYALCSPDGAACVDSPTAAVQMLYAIFASCSPGVEPPEAAHSCYGDLVLKIPQHLLLKRCLRADDTLATSNYDVGVSLALEASGMDVKATEASTARQWLKTSKRAGRRPSLNCAHLATRLGRITPCRAQIEWYKALFDGETGYYDAFKQRRSPKKFSKANMCRIKLGQFWDGVLAMLDAGQLPHDFHRRAKWVNAARFYQLLVEPLDVADYHRQNLHRMHGSYVCHGRERRYELFDRWWKERGCTATGIDVAYATTASSAASSSIRRRSKYAGLTQDPCFWARVEEAREQTEIARGERDPAELALTLEKLQEFERYSGDLVVSKEVSVDVLAPQSSYTLWVEEWKQLKLRDEVRTMLLRF